MIKNSRESLEYVASHISSDDLANFKRTIEILKRSSFSTLSEQQLFDTLERLNDIGRLQLDQKFYAFSVCDEAYDEGMEGVRLYRRIGDSLSSVVEDCERVPYVTMILEYLEDHGISEVYTGSLMGTGGFLGLKYDSGGDYPTITEPLENFHASELEEKGIAVIYLDSLL